MMEVPKYVFCEWESRFWPAKVVSKAKRLPKNNKLMVQIFAVNEKINVKFTDTKPFLKVELDKIAEMLDVTENCEKTKEELTYRRALREALEIIKQISKSVTENIDKSKESSSTGSQISIKTKTSTEGKDCESSTIIAEQQRSKKRSKAEGDLKTIKEERDFCTATTDELSVYSKRRRTKTLSPLTKLRHTDNKKNSRKRPRDTDEDLDGKITKLNVLSHSHSRKGQQCSPKNGISRGKLKGSSCSAKQLDRFIIPSVTDNSGSDKMRPICNKQGVKKNKVQKITSKSLAASLATDLQHAVAEEGGLSSSEQSMEISSPESNFLDVFSQKDDTEEDIQLPVIVLQQEPVSFVPGSFVWCKYQRFPYWPSLVQTVYRKDKKARVIFLDQSLCEPNEKKQSYKVAFHTLKHYDCPEKPQLLENSYTDYAKFFVWCNSLISDYRIRLGCGSFSGSFVDYCTADISLPVRREIDSDRKWIFSSSTDPDPEDPESSNLQPEMVDSKPHVKKKLLPDRKRAARDRENIKLVDYIVRTKRAEKHLLGILKGKKKSKWLKKFQSSVRRVNCLETYLEDEDQMELVVAYLQTLCENMNNAEKKLMNGDQTRFILEVLLPEAVIFALSATDQISYEKAEMKYLKGPSVSKRERRQFEEQILEKKRVSENLECVKGSN